MVIADMSETETQLKTELVSIAKRFEMEPEDVVEIYKQKLQSVKDNYAIPLPEDEEAAQAVKLTQAALVTQRATANVTVGGGEMLEVLAVGYSEGRWRKKDSEGNFIKDANGDFERKPVLYGNAIVFKDGTESRATIIIDSEDGHDMAEAQRAFETLNSFKGMFSVSESEGLPNAYKAFSTGDTEFDEDSEHFGEMDMATRMATISKYTDDVNLLNIMESMSSTTVADNGNTYLTDFGIDVKCIKGTVLSAYKSKDNDRGNYVVIDDSIIDPEEELSGTPLLGERSTVPGLTIWCDKSRVKYGKGSLCNFYGVVKKNPNTAQVTMELRGVVPLMAEPLEGGVAPNATTTDI